MEPERIKKFTILLVEDEENLATGLSFNLKEEGYSVILAKDGREAMTKVEEGEFDLVVLDVILPYFSGYEILTKIRLLHPRLPVIILTAKLEVGDRVKGLELGADDYLTKPFHLKELLLRIKGMLRRFSWYEEKQLVEKYFFGKNWVDFRTLETKTISGDRILTAREAQLLRVFIENEGEILNRERLLEEVWGYPPDMVTRTVDAFIARLRSYFESDPKKPVHIISIRSLGYKFIKDGA